MRSACTVRSPRGRDIALLDAERAGRGAVQGDRDADEGDLLAPLAALRAAARCRKRGSRLTCGTTAGVPDWATIAGDPFAHRGSAPVRRAGDSPAPPRPRACPLVFLQQRHRSARAPRSGAPGPPAPRRDRPGRFRVPVSAWLTSTSIASLRASSSPSRPQAARARRRAAVGPGPRRRRPGAPASGRSEGMLKTILRGCSQGPSRWTWRSVSEICELKCIASRASGQNMSQISLQ